MISIVMNKRPYFFWFILKVNKNQSLIRAKDMLLVLVSIKYSRGNILSKIIPDRLIGILLWKSSKRVNHFFLWKKKLLTGIPVLNKRSFHSVFRAVRHLKFFFPFFFLSSTPQVLILHVKAYFSQPVKIISFLVFTVVRIPF